MQLLEARLVLQGGDPAHEAHVGFAERLHLRLPLSTGRQERRPCARPLSGGRLNLLRAFRSGNALDRTSIRALTRSFSACARPARTVVDSPDGPAAPLSHWPRLPQRSGRVESTEVQERRLELIALFAGLAARLPAFFFGVEHYGDAPVRIELAERWLAAPHPWRGFTEAYQFGPGHLTLIAADLALWPARHWSPRLFSLACGLASVVLLFRLARRFVAKEAAFAASMILAFSSQASFSPAPASSGTTDGCTCRSAVRSSTPGGASSATPRSSAPWRRSPCRCGCGRTTCTRAMRSHPSTTSIATTGNWRNPRCSGSGPSVIASTVSRTGRGPCSSSVRRSRASSRSPGASAESRGARTVGQSRPSGSFPSSTTGCAAPCSRTSARSRASR
ncbi:MAG: glycosyltransferase family 39 protein [Deltaproteobacteria bacterium]|nr:MAG: glycosyltransferase family 39 protein [Deltaproteobacteria bacterium]